MQGGRGARQGQTSWRQRSSTREDIERTNARYEAYYNGLHLVDEAERDEFWNTLRRDLPNSFRFTGSKGQALPVQQLLKDRYIPEIISMDNEGEKFDPPTPISWFPNQLAWQMTTSKNIVRRFAPFKAFQKFIVSETEVGNISRQEIVSMIPPLLMDLKPGMSVLDLCAAPGSKSAQLVELLHAGEEARLRQAARKAKRAAKRSVSPDGKALEEEMGDESANGDWSDAGRATGLLIANDVDYKRSHMLTHQLKRLNSPNLIITNHDATFYPSIKLPAQASVKNRYLKFDRILADVPCSGDGTSRKNVNVWKDWTPMNAIGLFSTQLKILVRALQMLKAGGRVVYSTCSMNPVENEAVIAAAVERCGGLSKVDLVDCSAALPGLKRKPGLMDWAVMDKAGRIWNSWQDVEQHGDGDFGKVTPSMFAPAHGSVPLDRCMRIYPHLQDTGAFFITVVEKRTEFKVKAESSANKADATKPSILDVVKEVENQPTANGHGGEPKSDAINAFAPSSAAARGHDSSAAARQNKEIAPSGPVDSKKRSLDGEADAAMSTKRPKFREEVDDPAPQGAEDRQVHWPPPPGATLDVSRPETLIQSPSSPHAPAEASAEPGLVEGDQRQSQPSTKQKQKPAYEEPFIYLAPDQEDLLAIRKFYETSPDFPGDRFMVRNALGKAAKTIYYTSATAKDILQTNEGSGIKFVHCGIKMFVKQDVQDRGACKWRIQSEGLPLIESSVGQSRCVRLYKRSTLRALLIEMFPKVEEGAWRELGEIGEQVRDIGMGCCVLRIEKWDPSTCGGIPEAEGFSDRMVLPLWRSFHSLNLMLPKEDRRAMLLRLFNEDTPLQDHSKDRFKKGGKGGDEAGEEMMDADADDGGVPVEVKEGDAHAASSPAANQADTVGEELREEAS